MLVALSSVLSDNRSSPTNAIQEIGLKAQRMKQPTAFAIGVRRADDRQGEIAAREQQMSDAGTNQAGAIENAYPQAVLQQAAI
jgi:hypothetical protein